MSTSISNYFSNRVEEIISNFTGHTLIFFKGFGIEQVQQIITHPNSLLKNTSLLHENHLDLEELHNKWLDLASSITTATKPLIGFYEELLTIREFLPRINVDKIIIVENNILSPWVPCYFPYRDAEMLFDFWQSERESPDGIPSQLVEMYGAVKLLNEERALLLPATLDDARIKVIPFWQGNMSMQELLTDDIEHIEVGSMQDWEYCFDITNGRFTPALFLQNENSPSSRIDAILCASNLLGFEVFLDELELYQENVSYDDSQFIHVLKKYWGDTAEFRPLLFYKDPDRSQETEIISQGQIIAEIVDQCEVAQNGEPFSNIFITAPTGSGKSILFQIPAVYLAEKYNLVTIVVSPLIALMNDQVDQLQHERGVSIAACINSNMSLEDRSKVIDQIHSGEKSLLYLAPELLLSTHLRSFLGGRSVGMIVIDEAHTVTSWGRDFRSDYWFLGDFLKQTYRDGLIFPVLCLTATAVYSNSGDSDVVNDTIQELGLEKTIVHLGNVKRNNISFDIQCHNPTKADGKIEKLKADLTLKRMKQYLANGEKALAYFPYRTQVESIYTNLNTTDHIKIRRYHGQLSPAERKLVERDYKSGTAMGLFCTKAFGMGIDVGDIKHVIHFAPTGTLSDYVQEIGRAARNRDVQGIAHIDYFPNDLRYVKSLNSISEMRQYQLREMLKKICAIQKAKERRNLLISPETFEYLFKENEVENRTKSGLLLLSKDLNSKHQFPVLIVRPKAMLSKNYVAVPNEIESIFLKLYGPYCKLQQDISCRTIPTQNRHSDITIYSSGKIFSVDMAGIWENCYPDRSFGMFKKEFFEREFSAGGKKYHVAPRVRVEIRYSDDYSTVFQRVETVIRTITEIFEKHKNGDTKQFSRKDFEIELSDLLGEKIVPHDKVSMLLDIFTTSTDETAAYTQNRNRIRVLTTRKMPNKDEAGYFVNNAAYANLPNLFISQISQCAVKTGNHSFFRFYPMDQNNQIEIMPLLRFMELLGLATYEIRGGEKAEVFIRINDPEKLNRLARSGKYVNGVLESIVKRHRKDNQLLAAFFTTAMDDNARWELIEQYFLGNEDYVKHILHILD